MISYLMRTIGMFWQRKKDSHLPNNNVPITIGAGSVLMHTASINNAQADPSKIIIGCHTYIRGELFIFGHGGQITIGDYCYIGEHTRIWSARRIVIGNRVLIAHNVNIHDNISHPVDPQLRHEHYKRIITTGHPREGLDLGEREVIIEDDAWIGFNATIMRGVHIGRGAIVGACSVVTKDVPEMTIVAGNPAKELRKL
jgi:acetyltransferase-like isoleucine patch superfamily enzyme